MKYRICSTTLAIGTVASVLLAIGISQPVIADEYSLTLDSSPIEGRLEPSDNASTEDNSYYDTYTFTGQAGQRISITMSSQEFDSYLILLDSNGNTIAQDDGAGSLNAQIDVVLPVDGIYIIYADSHNGEGGTYTLQASKYRSLEILPAAPLGSENYPPLGTEDYTPEAAEAAIPDEHISEETSSSGSIARATGRGTSLDTSERNSTDTTETTIETLEQRVLQHRENGDRRAEAVALNELGEVYVYLGRFPEAIETFKQALTLFEQTPEQNELDSIQVLSNLGRTYDQLGQYSQAIEIYQQAYQQVLRIAQNTSESSSPLFTSRVYRRSVLELYPSETPTPTPAPAPTPAPVDPTLDLPPTPAPAPVPTPYESPYYESYEPPPTPSEPPYEPAPTPAPAPTSLYPRDIPFETIRRVREALSAYTESSGTDREAAEALPTYLASIVGQGSFLPSPRTRQALPLSTVLNDASTNEINTLIDNAEAYVQRGDFSRALELFSQALELYRELGDRIGEGTILRSIAAMFANPSLAFSDTNALRNETNNLQGREQEQMQGEQETPRAAFSIPERARSFAAPPAESSDESPNNLSPSPPAPMLGQGASSAPSFEQVVLTDESTEIAPYSQSLTFYQQALAIFEEADDSLNQLSTLNEIGSLYRRIGQYSQASDAYEKALAVSQSIDSLEERGIALNNIGEIHRNLGHYSQALEFYQQALELFENTNYEYGEGSTLNNIGLTHDSLGEHSVALSYYQRALAIHKEIDALDGQSISLHNIGFAYDQLNQNEQALKFYQEALTLREAINDPNGRAITLNNLGLLYNEQGQQDQALSALEQALAIFREWGDRPNEGNTLDSLATVYKSQGEYSTALDYYQQALAILQDVGDRTGVGIVLTNMGDLQEQQGSKDEAIRLYQQAIDEVIETTLAELRGEELQAAFADKHADTYAKLIRLLWDQGRTEEAFNYSERARARIFLNQFANESINLRTNAANPDLVQRIQALSSEISEVNNQLISLNRLPGTSNTTEEIANLRQALATREQEYASLVAQLREENLEAADLLSTSPATLTEIQALLDTGTTLVSYFVMDDRTLAFLITHDTLTPITLEVGRQNLQDQIQMLYDYDFATLDDPHPASLRQLYAWLIEPLQPHLSNSTLEIVPHNVLHYVPFAALTNGEEYLIDQYTLTHLPSASVKRFLEAKRKPETETLMALGNPTFDLSYAKEEVEAISNVYQSQPRVGTSATENLVQAEASQASILHLATHGEYNLVAPLLSTLYLTPTAEYDGRLQVYEIYELDLTSNTNLVVLSACQTQIGQLSRGDEIIGLSRAFLYAGTPNVMASLWNIDDRATSALMEHFYSYLQQGNLTKAEALQNAQREIRSAYPHPYYWAAFVLTGDGY